MAMRVLWLLFWLQSWYINKDIKNYIWNLTVLPLRRPYNIYNFKHQTDAPTGEIVLPLDALIPCVENATKLCVPGVTPICTTFNEIMCVETLSASTFSESYNTTCIKHTIPCLDNDPLCRNKTEDELTTEGDKTLLKLDLPCFANITINSNVAKFDIASFNGTVPVGSVGSFTYHYHYCVVTLGVPGAENDICVAGPPPESAKS
ncbi:hypothetical protein NQ318_011578 [Aromia moschata]|uniref:Uncharacterized protein n=1 Tax=Aromia moschata TaxID=1265417 RepID=A0AAV8Z994_9CUCU|nr:hypothetical protein NQ318_011578 [Aromia moschata]